MRIINKKYLLIILLIVVIITGVIVAKPKEEVKLDNVILKQDLNNKTFAMYKEDDDNNYVKVEDNKFPDMYVLNLTESKCIDNNGNEIKDALSYENDEVVLTTNKSSYCYLYFDKSLGLEIKEKNPQGLSTDQIRGDMYRFQGQAKDENGNELVDNYICFGTSKKEDCVKDTDHYMYRIIGIEAKTGRVKVIKKEALEGTYKWYTDSDTDIEFPNSIIYETINGTEFLKNNDYVPVKLEEKINWEEKISTNTWMYGDIYAPDTLGGALQLASEIYLIESGQKEAAHNLPNSDIIEYYKWTEKTISKISLINISDYNYSVSDDAICHYGGGKYTICQTSWINLRQNDTDAFSNNDHEWTITRFGWHPSNKFFCGIAITNMGYTSSLGMEKDGFIRPVFYINASEELLGGIGTLEDPFIIAN